jgi:hypothetical protein
MQRVPFRGGRRRIEEDTLVKPSLLFASLMTAVCTLIAPLTPPAELNAAGAQPGSQSIHFHAGTSARDIPFRYELGHIIVSVQVADSLAIDMMLDSGFGVNGAILLDPAIGEALHLRYSGQTPLGGGGTTPMFANVATNASFSLPGVTFAGQTLLVVTDPEPYRSYPARGIIGKTVFDCTVEIDYETSRIHLHDADAYRPPDGCTSLETTFTFGVPVVQATLDRQGAAGIPVKLIVDTGAVQLLLFSWTSAGIQLPERLVTARERILSKGFNGIVLGSSGRIPRLHLGPYTLNNVVTSFPDSATWGSAMVLGQDGMLGNDGLRHFFVAFDYAHQRIHLKPNARFADPFETDMSGMMWEPTPEGSVSVVDVIPDSPATESGIETGDVIVAIDGRPPQESGWAALEKLFMQEGARARLTIERGNERLEKALTIRRVI